MLDDTFRVVQLLVVVFEESLFHRNTREIEQDTCNAKEKALRVPRAVNIGWRFTARMQVFGETRTRPSRCRTSAAVLTFFAPIFSTAQLYPNSIFRASKQKVLVAPAPLTIFTKHTVKPQCRCWCDFVRTSPAPLLEISETSVISS